MENTISQAAFEFTVEKIAQANKRLVIIIVALIIALIGSNIAWIVYEAQFEDTITTETTQTVEQNADNGTNRFIGGNYYGNTESNNENENDEIPNP